MLQVFVSIDSFPTGELVITKFCWNKTAIAIDSLHGKLLQFCSLRQFVTIENMSDLQAVCHLDIYIYISLFKGWSLYPTDHAFEIQRILDPTGSDYGFISCAETAQAYGRDVQHGGF